MGMETKGLEIVGTGYHGTGNHGTGNRGTGNRGTGNHGTGNRGTGKPIAIASNPFACLTPPEVDYRTTVDETKNGGKNRGKNRRKNRGKNRGNVGAKNETTNGEENETVRSVNEDNVNVTEHVPNTDRSSVPRRKMAPRDYIMTLSIDDLAKLGVANQHFIDLTNSLIIEKAHMESDMRKNEQEIRDLCNSMKTDYPQNLKQLAQKQLTDATERMASRATLLASLLDVHSMQLDCIRAMFPEYDFTSDIEMSKHIAETLRNKRVMQEKIAHQEKIHCEKQELEDLEKKRLKKKLDYVVTRVIPFLSKNYKLEVFEPCMAKMHQEDYLNELIKDAHLGHYMGICRHDLDFEIYSGMDYFINDSTTHDCNGNDTYDPCCHKRFATGVSIDILEFNNDYDFNLDSNSCNCDDDIRIN